MIDPTQKANVEKLITKAAATAQASEAMAFAQAACNAANALRVLMETERDENLR